MTKKIFCFSLLALTIVFSGCSNNSTTPTVQVPTTPQETVVQTSSQPSPVATKEPEKPKIIEKKIGEEASVAGMTFKVNSSKETQTLTTQYSSPVSASEGTKFIVVDMTLTNEGSSDASFFADTNFRLIDAEKNREYTTDSDNITNVDNYLAVRKLGPGIPEKGLIVYKVPKTLNKYALVALNDPSNDGSTGVMVFLSTGGQTQEEIK